MSTALEAEIQSPRLEKAILLMESKNFEEAEIELKTGIDESQSSEDVVMEAIYQSTLGVLHKLKKDYKMAWKYYENAERLLPHDPALKIISARLLVDIFGQYDTAIKKMEKVLKLVQDDQPFIHQAYTVMGLAYLKKGDRKKALTCFQDSMKDDFQKMITAQNIDSSLMGALLKKELGLEESKVFLEKALRFAQETQEVKMIELFQNAIRTFPGVGDGVSEE